MKKSQKNLNARLKLIEANFIRYVNQTLIARCHWFQMFINPKAPEMFMNINTFTPNPAMPPEAIPLPPISACEDFKCLSDFIIKHSDKISPDRLFSSEVFAEAYFALMQEGLFEQYVDFRKKYYLNKFKTWVKTFEEKIKEMDF